SNWKQEFRNPVSRKIKKAMHTAVFISYARIKDQYGGVTKFHSALDKAVKERFNMETQVFMDKKGITAGENFNDVIKAQLKEASVLIIFLSPVWLSRPMCREEYQYFKSLQNSNDKKRFI